MELDGEIEADGDNDGEADEDVETLGERDEDGDTEADADAEADIDGEKPIPADGDGDCEADADSEGDKDGDAEADADTDGEREAVLPGFVNNPISRPVNFVSSVVIGSDPSVGSASQLSMIFRMLPNSMCVSVIVPAISASFRCEG